MRRHNRSNNPPPLESTQPWLDQGNSNNNPAVKRRLWVQKVCQLHASVARLKLYARKPRISTGLHVDKELTCVPHCRWALRTRLEANASQQCPFRK
ncbi:hypothetical protein KL951_003112 [Ogataea haglerorum]|nr:hypothetical protein KL951_003112 [Ogataea haglerorum]